MILTGNFTLNVYYYQLPLNNHSLLIYCSLFTPSFTRDQRRRAGSGVVIRRIFEIRGKLRIFLTCYNGGTLTNKANISI